ncbi:MAG: hypothetical protein PHT07_21660 [Paludibacter sp.]|nr:hypothetical protein [Paludibacter sp.]
MYGILCQKDGDPKVTIPIVNEDGDVMATWETLQKAKDFAIDHILCRMSRVIYIDLFNAELYF